MERKTHRGERMTEKPLRLKEIWQIEELRAKINHLNIEMDKLKIRIESKEQSISLLYNILNNSYIIKHDEDLQKQLKLFREKNSIMGDFEEKELSGERMTKDKPNYEEELKEEIKGLKKHFGVLDNQKELAGEK